MSYKLPTDEKLDFFQLVIVKTIYYEKCENRIQIFDEKINNEIKGWECFGFTPKLLPYISNTQKYTSLVPLVCLLLDKNTNSFDLIFSYLERKDFNIENKKMASITKIRQKDHIEV